MAQTMVDALREQYPDQTEFLDAVNEVASDVIAVEKANADFARARVLERLAEPDRTISFSVPWVDSAGETRLNRGWRVQMSNAIGPYKGGLRFHPTVNPSILKFLAFEQVFKNALTGLPLGGAKGGADFDPRGESETDIMRFCQAFMGELVHHIGPDRDVPAGDINVGAREIGWLFGAYKRHGGRFEGALTGKGPSFGGSALRPEATGFGLIYFVQTMLEAEGDAIDGQRVAISGKGNVATHAALKAIRSGARVVSLSDTSGTLHCPDGLTEDAVAWVRERKSNGQDVADPPKSLGIGFLEGKTPWQTAEVDIALPCATQNEVQEDDARALVDRGIRLLAEGANMPLTRTAAALIDSACIPYAPGKASNAGGVAISGLEMSQNSHRRFLAPDEVDTELRRIMRDLHDRVHEEGKGHGPDGRACYRRGANVAGYRRVASAVVAQGVM